MRAWIVIAGCVAALVLAGCTAVPTSASTTSPTAPRADGPGSFGSGGFTDTTRTGDGH